MQAACNWDSMPVCSCISFLKIFMFTFFKLYHHTTGEEEERGRNLTLQYFAACNFDFNYENFLFRITFRKIVCVCASATT